MQMEKKKRAGRPKKYATSEEARAAKLLQTNESIKRRRARKRRAMEVLKRKGKESVGRKRQRKAIEARKRAVDRAVGRTKKHYEEIIKGMEDRHKKRRNVLYKRMNRIKHRLEAKKKKAAEIAKRMIGETDLTEIKENGMVKSEDTAKIIQLFSLGAEETSIAANLGVPRPYLKRFLKANPELHSACLNARASGMEIEALQTIREEMGVEGKNRLRAAEVALKLTMPEKYDKTKTIDINHRTIKNEELASMEAAEVIELL